MLHAALAPGATMDIGFQAGHTGSTAPPSSYTLNGTPCAVAEATK
ncbi:cellulose binding domain-containing protein [Streptomyces coeruleorubidus]